MDAAHVMEEFAILDIDFHIELLRLSGNGLFASLGKALRARWVRLAFDAYRNGDGLRETTSAEHREICRAVISGDPTVAREAARKHIWLARSRWNERHARSQPTTMADELKSGSIRQSGT